MPAPRQYFDDLDRERLRQALERELTFPLDSRSACNKAAMMLGAKGGSMPSATTLYQLFVASTGDRKPYMETLHALSRSLGYRDWNKFREGTEVSLSGATLVLDQFQVLPELMASCLRRACYEVLDDLFEGWSDRLDHGALYDLGFSIYLALLKDPGLAKPFYVRYADHPVVRRAYFEVMADPYFRIADADDGLQHYLDASAPVEEEKGFQDHLFGRSMLFRHHYLTRDGRVLDQGRSLYSNGIDLKQLNAMHVFPAARYLMYSIWYDVVQRRTERRKRRESMVIEWASARLLESRTTPERNIIKHTLLEGFRTVGLLDRVLPDLLRIFPEVDPNDLKEPSRFRELLSSVEANSLNERFKVHPQSR
jgi:hypothetical protein